MQGPPTLIFVYVALHMSSITFFRQRSGCIENNRDPIPRQHLSFELKLMDVGTVLGCPLLVLAFHLKNDNCRSFLFQMTQLLSKAMVHDGYSFSKISS